MHAADSNFPLVAEEPLRFHCEGETLIGVLALPEAAVARLAIVILVGGPQYRAGSHRQFVMLARCLAQSGWPALRFDHRGIGDSSGEARSFADIGADIRIAVDQICERLPDVEGVVLWGLCDAASAAMMYAASDSRIVGLVLANPWARAPQTYARTRLRHYYLQRVLSVDFWRKLASNRFRFRHSFLAFADSVDQAMKPTSRARDYRGRMLDGLGGFSGRILWLFSGRDLTAREFRAFLQQESAAGYLEGVNARRIDIPDADHTFAHDDWRSQVESATCDWLRDCWPDKCKG